VTNYVFHVNVRYAHLTESFEVFSSNITMKFIAKKETTLQLKGRCFDLFDNAIGRWVILRRKNLTSYKTCMDNGSHFSGHVFSRGSIRDF
jgi:hypothetical protein